MQVPGTLVHPSCASSHELVNRVRRANYRHLGYPRGVVWPWRAAIQTVVSSCPSENGFVTVSRVAPSPTTELTSNVPPGRHRLSESAMRASSHLKAVGSSLLVRMDAQCHSR